MIGKVKMITVTSIYDGAGRKVGEVARAQIEPVFTKWELAIGLVVALVIAVAFSG